MQPLYPPQQLYVGGGAPFAPAGYGQLAAAPGAAAFGGLYGAGAAVPQQAPYRFQAQQQPRPPQAAPTAQGRPQVLHSLGAACGGGVALPLAPATPGAAAATTTGLLQEAAPDRRKVGFVLQSGTRVPSTPTPIAAQAPVAAMTTNAPWPPTNGGSVPAPPAPPARTTAPAASAASTLPPVASLAAAAPTIAQGVAAPTAAPTATATRAQAMQAANAAAAAAAAASSTGAQAGGGKEEMVEAALAQRGIAKARHPPSRNGMPAGMIGKGGFGVVYKAKTADGVECAVKMIEGVSALESLIDTELRVLQLLEHPSIVRFLDAFTVKENDWMFIAMEFVDGGDLLQALRDRPHVFDEALLRPVMFHIACALGYAHELGIMHRDLKPENIMLRGDYFPKVTDFGLARVLQPAEVLQTMVGTPGYMAPEIGDPRVPYDFPADTFSLGLVFAGMLDERSILPIPLPPQYDGMDAVKTFGKRWPPGRAPPQLSPELRAIAQQMVAQAPGERPTILQVCEQLLALERQDSRPHALWAVPTRRPSGPPPRRTVTADMAAEIAGRGGYGVGVCVLVFVEGVWRPGRVKKVSTTLCPGALQVHFHDDSGEKAVLVCPWQFSDLLRPDTNGGLPPEPPLPTMVFHLLPTEQEVLPSVSPSAATAQGASGGVKITSDDELNAWLRNNGYAGVNQKRTKLFRSKYPLHTAVKQRNRRIVEALLRAGADPLTKNTLGQTPLQLATRTNARGANDAIIRLLS
eukprot:TRINITY_DN2858_c0_g3_i2.p1 TRINITY_DN2858_c0_g3~~TRINITY_DN2858_c0_g3_i2.p1  ORF type:complete len:747 (-),score=161.88 TRINITY_DN2858_c0_g3_i2:284-2524(-)